MIVLEVDFKGFSRGFLNGAWINFGKTVVANFLEIHISLENCLLRFFESIFKKQVFDRMILSFCLYFVEIQKCGKCQTLVKKSIIEQVLFG